ncbi:MAG: hypothetical protein PVJ64_02910 [Gemmatimonadales bacterium]
MPRKFQFRKGDGRKKKRIEGRGFWVEETTLGGEVVHEEIGEGDPELGGIHEIARQVGDDLSDGKITEEEAKRRLTSAVGRLTKRGSEFCLMCGGRKQRPGALVCDSCVDDVEVETEVEIHFEGFDED